MALNYVGSSNRRIACSDQKYPPFPPFLPAKMDSHYIYGTNQFLAELSSFLFVSPLISGKKRLWERFASSIAYFPFPYTTKQ